MNLTTVERVIICNQCRILEALYPKEATFYANTRKAIENGYVSHYSSLTESLESEFPREESRYVLDVLQMYSDLKLSFEALRDKTGIEPRDIVFRGFDGNSEGQHMGYAEYFVEDLGRFQTLEIKEFNSHMPTRDLYEPMLAAWKEAKDKKQGRDLFSKDEILTIVTAWKRA